MKSTDLRLGNRIIRIDNLGNEQEITVTASTFSEMEVKCGVTYKGIPITEERLLECGFEVCKEKHVVRYTITILQTKFYLRPCYRGGYFWGFTNIDVEGFEKDCEIYNVQQLMFIHNLQNLCFYMNNNTELIHNKIQ